MDDDRRGFGQSYLSGIAARLGLSALLADDDDRMGFYALYLTRFAEGFGFVTLLTLLPTYIDLFDPSGLVIGLFTSAVTITQTLVIIPLAWGGDRYDKRVVLQGGLVLSVFVYASFALVGSSLGFIGARAMQGVVVTATGLMGLAMVGQLAVPGTRANRIGTANAWRLAAGIFGALAAGVLYELAGFTLVFAVVSSLLAVSMVGVSLFVDRDHTRIEGFPFSDLAVNRRILTITSFRFQYSFAVTLVRTWVPIYAGVAAFRGGLAASAIAVSIVITAEKFTNMIFQPYTGRLSDRIGRAQFVFAGGATYGLVALAVPFAPAIGAVLPVPSEIALPVIGGFALSISESAALTIPAVLPLGESAPAIAALLVLNGLLGIADAFREPASMALFADEGTSDGGVASSFGIRELVWRPGSVIAPLIGGVLMTDVSMASVFYVGGGFALTGVLAFFLILWRDHGASALREW